MPILKPEERLGSILAERYRLDEILGKGGMGVVFAGTHTWNNRRIAVKVLLPQYAENEEVLKRFFREAEAVAALDHPNVVEVLDSGEDDEGDAYIVLELLHGESLGAALARDGRLSVEETLSILVPVLDGLVFAHERGVVHRDLKPDNIFLSRDARDRRVPKLLDFGVAKLAESTSSFATRTGSVLGTPQYMSPEQAGSGAPVDAASDVWSMGVVLYRCLAGTLPVEADSMAQVLVKILSGPPIAIRAAAPHVPMEIAAVVDRALTRSRAERFPTMEALLDALLDAGRRVGFEVERDGSTRALSLSKRPPPRDPGETSGAPRGEAPSTQLDAPDVDRAGTPGVDATYAKTVRLDSPARSEADGPHYTPTVHLDGEHAAPESATAAASPGAEPLASSRTTAIATPRTARTKWILSAVLFAAALSGIAYAVVNRPTAVTRTVVSDPPGARVQVDGQPAGTTPAAIEVTDARSREVRLELEGHWPEHIYVAHSDPDTIEVELRPRESDPETVTRRLVTTPPGAAVFVGDERRGVSPIDLSVSTARSLDVRLELDGHWPEHLYVSASDPEVVEVELRPR